MKAKAKVQVIYRIYKVLQEVDDLNWHAWHWWAMADEWFAQFDPTDIDEVAQEMAEAGMIETNGRYGYRRKEKTLKERISLKLLG